MEGIEEMAIKMWDERAENFIFLDKTSCGHMELKKGNISQYISLQYSAYIKMFIITIILYDGLRPMIIYSDNVIFTYSILPSTYYMLHYGIKNIKWL